MTTRLVTTSGNVNQTDEVIVCYSTSDIYLNLPPSAATQRQLVVKNIGTGIVYICSSEYLDAGHVKKLYQYDTIELVDYATGEWIVARYVDPPKLRVVKKTIGNVGVTGCDFNFVTAANHTEQCIDLGEIIPAKARLVDIFVHTDAAFTNLGALVTDVGFTTGSGALIVAADITALAAILQPAVGAAFTWVAIIATAQHIWINADPANNWNSATPVGKMSVYVTYVDVTDV
jgi:hypothetical protein